MHVASKCATLARQMWFTVIRGSVEMDKEFYGYMRESGCMRRIGVGIYFTFYSCISQRSIYIVVKLFCVI